MARFPLDQTYVITQGFGLTPYAKTGVYGYTNGRPNPHTGIDIAASCGKTVYWPKGIPRSVYHGWEPGGYGNFAVGTYPNGDEVWYGHFGRFGSGEVAGYVGSTGKSSGCHSHFEVRRNGRAIDPIAWLNEDNSDMYAGYTAKQAFEAADLYNGFAKDGLALRIIGRKLNPQEMKDYKGFTIDETVRRLRNSQAHRDAVNLVFKAAFGIPATDEEYKYPPRFEQDLPDMLRDLMGTERSKKYHARG